MSACQKCPQCGAELSSAAFEGLCPACLIGVMRNVNLSPAPPTPTLPIDPTQFQDPKSNVQPTTLRYFGDYELLEEIARGGMGVVYKARQVSLNRIVAVKMILAGQLASTADRQRFRAEAEAAANLQHPNIVAIHEVGEHEGQHYFSMDYIEGRDLADLVRENPMSATRAARYVQIIGEAIHHAHAKGTLHRDLKPSNVLIDANDQPRVTDFGLAKRLTDSELGTRHSELTVSGQVLGTPNYMPPEQAAARHGELGPSSDVYSLGAILYYLLTGRPPFVAETMHETLTQVLQAEPVPPRLQNPSVPRDLETICLKCLEKAPQRRYRSAHDLAAELGRFGRGEPIQARRASAWEKGVKLARRHPAIAGLLALVLVVGAMGIGGILWQWRKAETNAEQSRQRLVRLHLGEGLRALEQGDPNGSLPHFVEALSLDRPQPHREAIHRLRLGTVLQESPRLLDVLWIARDTAFPPSGLAPLAFDQEFKRALDNGNGAVWEIATGRRIASLGTNFGPFYNDGPNRAVFSTDGRLVARAKTVAGDEGQSDYVSELRVWEAHQWQTVFRAGGIPGDVDGIAFSPDATRLLSLSQTFALRSDSRQPKRALPEGELRIWEITTGRLLAGPLKILPMSTFIGFGMDGRLVAFAGINGVEVFEVSTGRTVYRETPRGHSARAVTFIAEDRICIERDDGIEVIKLVTGKVVRSVKLPGTVAGLGPDGRFSLSISRNTEVQVCDSESGKVMLSLLHPDNVTQARFSPDGRRVLTSCADKAVRLWDASTGALLGVPLKHETAPRAMFAPDGHRFITLAAGTILRIWSMVGMQPAQVTLLHTAPVSHAIYSPKGEKVLTASTESVGGMARIWETSQGLPSSPSLAHREAIAAVAFGSNGASFTTVTEKHTAQIWDATAFQPMSETLSLPDYTNASTPAICLSPDGRLLAETRREGAHNGRIDIWDIASRKVLLSKRPAVHESWFTFPAFSADGHLLAVPAGQSPNSAVYDLRTGEDLLEHVSAKLHLWPPYLLSPNNQMFVQGVREGEPQPQLTLVFLGRDGPTRSHPCPGGVNAMGFSADSRRLISAHADGTARAWDVPALTPSLPALRHQGPVLAVCFSPDGRLLATASADRTARIWDAATGEPLTAPLSHSNSVHHVAFRADSLQLLTRDDGPMVRLWNLTLEKRSIRTLTVLAQLMAGHWTDESGAAAHAEADLPAKWKLTRQEFPRLFSVTLDEARQWHEQEATSSERSRQWFAARFHLEKLLETKPQDTSIRSRFENACSTLTNSVR